MDKQTQKPNSESQEQNQGFVNSAPGQQLPLSEEVTETNAVPAKDERHSESSLPQRDNETLGTP